MKNQIVKLSEMPNLRQTEFYVAELKKRQKIGIQNYIQQKKTWGPKIKFGTNPLTHEQLSESDFKTFYREMRNKGMSKKNISNLLEINIDSLNKRVKKCFPGCYF